MIVIGPSGSIVEQRNESTDSDSGDINAAVASIQNFSKKFQNQMNRMEQRLVGVEKKQDGLSQALKDISDLIKALKKDSFGIKGSPYEVKLFHITRSFAFVYSMAPMQISLKIESGRLFCKSPTRNPQPSDIQVATYS